MFKVRMAQNLISCLLDFWTNFGKLVKFSDVVILSLP